MQWGGVQGLTKKNRIDTAKGFGCRSEDTPRVIQRREGSAHQWGLDEEVGMHKEFLKEEEDWYI